MNEHTTTTEEPADLNTMWLRRAGDPHYDWTRATPSDVLLGPGVDVGDPEPGGDALDARRATRP